MYVVTYMCIRCILSYDLGPFYESEGVLRCGDFSSTYTFGSGTLRIYIECRISMGISCWDNRGRRRHIFHRRQF